MRIQKKHSTFVFSETDFRNLEIIKTVKGIKKNNTAAIQFALQYLADAIQEARSKK